MDYPTLSILLGTRLILCTLYFVRKNHLINELPFVLDIDSAHTCRDRPIDLHQVGVDGCLLSGVIHYLPTEYIPLVLLLSSTKYGLCSNFRTLFRPRRYNIN